MNRPISKRGWAAGWAVVLACVSIVWVAGASPVEWLEKAPEGKPDSSRGAWFWRDARSEPRPLAIHVVLVDLQSPAVEVAATVAPDPDGDGPATSQLWVPDALAASNGLCVAINANAFGGLPDSQGKARSDWHEGMPVNLCGWVAIDGKEIHQAQRGYCSFWIDSERRGHVDSVEGSLPAWQAVAGFGRLLDNGVVMPTEGGPMHPRSALGIDATGRWLWMVVVDGRQEGYSEGMTSQELAELMLSLGASNAVNLDGGGSSTMLVTNEDGRLRRVNRPSGRVLGMVTTRPVPVMIGVRVKAALATGAAAAKP